MCIEIYIIRFVFLLIFLASLAGEVASAFAPKSEGLN